MADRLTIYVAGFPKSGTTWLTRLLGDLTNSPTGGFREAEDGREIATEGRDRPGPFVIRKGHYVLVDGIDVPTVSAMHRLGYKNPDIYRMIHIVRDPRDIVVSASFYWGESFRSIAEQLVSGKGHFRAIGSWTKYVSSWLDLVDPRSFTVRYEDLHSQNDAILRALCFHMGYVTTNKAIDSAYERQSFENRVKHIMDEGDSYPLGKEFNMRFMRKGVAGDWKNHLRVPELKLITHHCGDLMNRLGYKWI